MKILCHVQQCNLNSTSCRYGEPTEEGYYKKIAQAFAKLRVSGASRDNYEPTVLFDGANGVGAIMMERFTQYLGDSIKSTMYNKGEGVLNHLCGADYVKVGGSVRDLCKNI